jgi:cysteine desulfurase/selenocysteine lyase
MTIDNLKNLGLPTEEDLEKILLASFQEFSVPKAPTPPVLTSPNKSYAPVLESVEPVKPQGASSSPSYHSSAYEDPRIVGIRSDFPILQEKVDGNDLVWFDNGATTQRPRQVIDRISYYYEHENSNIHRSAHTLARLSTDAYENARGKVASFLSAPSADQVVFVRGTTEGINLVANAFVLPKLKAGDEIILTLLEHHANIVPWQIIAQKTGALLKVATVDETGQVDLAQYASLFTPRTKFVSVTHVSNVLGTITPVKELIDIAHANGVRILVDAAQSVAHMQVNVSALDCDFLVFSGHKIYGPTGIGVVYGKAECLDEASVYQGGGNMIADVTFEKTIYQKSPNKFEAGTGSIADAVGLGAALEYISGIGLPSVQAHETLLLEYALSQLEGLDKLTVMGRPYHRAGVISFDVEGYDISEVGSYLSKHGIAVRAGHHCAQPILRHYGYEGSVRATFGVYNTIGEVDYFVSCLKNLIYR